MTTAVLAGLRRASMAIVIAGFCFAMAIPAFEDLERLFIGLAVIALILALIIVSATVAKIRSEGRPQA